jgi:hypothetical protein
LLVFCVIERTRVKATVTAVGVIELSLTDFGIKTDNKLKEKEKFVHRNIDYLFYTYPINIDTAIMTKISIKQRTVAHF